MRSPSGSEEHRRALDVADDVLPAGFRSPTKATDRE
jgi:hypothetical protein